MSDHDDALLDEDLGDEEYDLGNEEEEALLADDNDNERLAEKQTVIKGEEETDDVLDLGVTDALDDLETEEDNVHQLRSSKAEQRPRASDERRPKRQQSLEESAPSKRREPPAPSQESVVAKARPVEVTDAAAGPASSTPARAQIDLRQRLREKASNNQQREAPSSKERRADEDDAEDAKERRNRFQSERSTLPAKMNHEIPDSLENVVTADQHRSHYRSRDRADRSDRSSRDKSDRGDRSDRYERSDRRGVKSRAGRYEPHQPPRYHPHEHEPLPPPSQQQPHQHQHHHQQAPAPPVPQPPPPPQQPGPPPPQFRGGPMLDGRPPFPPGAPPGSGGPMPQQPHHHMYPVHGPQGPPGAAPPQQPQPHPPQAPPGPGAYHHPVPPRFMDGPVGPMQPHPGQYPEPMRAPGLRMGVPRMDYGPRGPLQPPAGLGPAIPGHPGGPPGPPGFGQPQYVPPYPGHGMPPERQGPAPGQGPPPMGLAHPGPHQGPRMMPPAGAGQGVPPGFARPQPPLPRPSGPPGPPNQPQPQQQQHPMPYEARLPQQLPHQPQPHYEPSRAAPAPYVDSRGGYGGNPPTSQYNSGPPRPQVPQSAPQQQPQQQVLGVAGAPSVPVLPAGHKILINPHFKGNQAKNDAKTPQEAADSFVQALRVKASNPTSRDGHSNSQPAKSDDPFSYFSDVWQESKSERSRPSNSRRSYSPETNYSKSSSHSSYDSKYKSDNHGSHRDSYSEKQEHRIRDSERYRDRDSPPRRKNEQRNHSPPRNSGHVNNSHDHSSGKFHKTESIKLSSGRELGAKITQKRSGDDMVVRNVKDDSPKKPRPAAKPKQYLEKTVGKPEVKEEEEMDPEMREYRKKMEEQKVLREKILREKENRRKLAAMQKQNLSSIKDVDNTDSANQESNIAAVIAKEKSKGKFSLSAVKARSRLNNIEEKALAARVVKAAKQLKRVAPSPPPEEEDEYTEDDIEYEYVYAHEDANEDEEEEEEEEQEEEDDNDDDDDDDGGKSELLSRIVMKKTKKALLTRNSQKSHVQKSQKASTNATSAKNRQLGQIRQLLTNSQRIVVQSASAAKRKLVAAHEQLLLQQQQQQQQQQQRQRQRIVLHKPPGQEVRKVVKSNIVRVDNLAPSTTEAQIRRMCQGIGSIESVQMGEGNATIVFKTQSAAMVFHKKYQRKMIDLSLVKVHLIPQIAASKASKILKGSRKD